MSRELGGELRARISHCRAELAQRLPRPSVQKFGAATAKNNAEQQQRVEKHLP